MVSQRTQRLLCALAAAPALAQPMPHPPTQPAAQDPGGERPRAAQRIVKHFDFEEQLTNPLDLPAGWIRAQHDPLVPRDRPTFPIWNRARLDYNAPAHSGQGSVRAEIEGGSTSLRLSPGVTPIFPHARYLIRAAYRCDNLTHARPRLVVRALDGAGTPIPGSERTTVADSIGPGWQSLAVELPGKFDNAAYLQIDLEVVQPREFQEPTLPNHQLWEQDFEGTVWFDDVVVAQVPQLYLDTPHPLAVFASPERPTLTASLRDMTAQDMTATITVFDADRQPVDAMARPIAAGRVNWDWQPELDAFGWYRAVIEITAAGNLIATDTRDFVYLGPTPTERRTYTPGPAFQGEETNAGTPDARSVGVELTRLPPASPDELARALAALGARTATLPLWSSDLTAGEFARRVDRLRLTLAACRTVWVAPRLSIPVVPRDLAAPLRITADDVVDALLTDADRLDPFLAEALDKLGATTARWQIGPAGSETPFARDDLAADLADLRARFESLVPGITLGLGWRADLDPAAARRSGADALRVQLPAWSSASPHDALLAPWLTPNAPTTEFVLEPATAALTERDTAADLARRAVSLWAAAGAHDKSIAAAIADPWRIKPGEEPVAHPTAAAAAWRNIADRLDGRSLAADWPIAAGVRCLVFTAPIGDPERGGLIVAWRQNSQTTDLRATLGAEPITIYDIFGNPRTQSPVSVGERFEHTVPLTDEPVFIENINTDLVRFLAGLAIDPPLIESSTGEHHHNLSIHNPWTVPATGRLVIVSPGGFDPVTQARDRTWEITPRTFPFDLAPGETLTLPVALALSRGVEAGTQTFAFDVELTADASYGWLRARANTEVGWRDVDLELTSRRTGSASGNDSAVIIEAAITNTGAAPRALEAIAFAPGQPRARASVGTLEPGQTVIRRFAFQGAAGELANQRVIVAITEADGPGRLTKSLTLPPR